MFVLMAAVAEVVDANAKITRDFCVVHENGPLRSCRLEAPIYVWIWFQSKCTKLGTGCQSEWDFRKAEVPLANARRLSEMKGDYTGFRKRLARSELVSPGGVKWIASAASDMDQGQISCHSAK